MDFPQQKKNVMIQFRRKLKGNFILMKFVLLDLDLVMGLWIKLNCIQLITNKPFMSQKKINGTWLNEETKGFKSVSKKEFHTFFKVVNSAREFKETSNGTYRDRLNAWVGETTHVKESLLNGEWILDLFRNWPIIKADNLC